MPLSTEYVTRKAKEAGFNLVGFARAEELTEETARLEEWLSLGYHSTMTYMERNTERRRNIKEILPSARSVISLGINYFIPGEHSVDNDMGKISRYAWGKDYHLVLWDKLDKLIELFKSEDPQFEAKSYVDTGPVMDKAWAVRAGLGWMGKNTNVINREKGSWFFIANIFCNFDFDYSLPSEDFCGSCTACIDACPTEALVKPYVLDAGRCISYQTIENKEEIHKELKGRFENWIYGCDICQDVCPWNKKFSVPAEEQAFYTEKMNKEYKLTDVVNMTQEEFSTIFKGSPVKRTKLKGIKRNAEFILNP